MTDPNYWDCNCKENFILPTFVKKCLACNAEYGDDQPDAHENELKEFLSASPFTPLLERIESQNAYLYSLRDQAEKKQKPYKSDPYYAIEQGVLNSLENTFEELFFYWYRSKDQMHKGREQRDA